MTNEANVGYIVWFEAAPSTEQSEALKAGGFTVEREMFKGKMWTGAVPVSRLNDFRTACDIVRQDGVNVSVEVDQTVYPAQTTLQPGEGYALGL